MPVPATVAVIGGGRMGAGIAHAFLVAGASSVVLVERDDAAALAAAGRVDEALARSADRDGIRVDEVAARLTVSTAMAAVTAAELVIEAVPEDAGLKRDALAAAEAELTEDAVLASNTSSLSIDALARALRRPERFLGLHFFNPVPASRLVEVVVGPRTDPALAERARDWVGALGKTPVTVRDRPGFASSRLGVALGLEAIRMLEEGVASAEDIDTAMTLGYRHPVGPLRTTDLVGLDVRLAIAEHLEAELGPRFAPPALLRSMVAEGRLGRKTGAGFYDWADE